MTIIHKLTKKGLINPPSFVNDNTHYLVTMGSTVYGAALDNSDRDVYGFCVPPRDIIFPHLAGHIPNFGKSPPEFNVWTKHHIKDGDTEWDFSVYSIIKYFSLVIGNNPNMLDTLWVASNHIIHMTEMAQHVRDNRRLFVHKGCYSKFRGYAMQQMHKIRSKDKPTNAKRLASYEKFGYDTKYAMHLVRLMMECEQILETHDMDLAKDAALYRKIRNGEWTLEYLEKWFSDKEKYLEELMNRTTIQPTVDDAVVKNLLLECLEMHYGSLVEAVKLDVPVEVVLRELESLIGRYRRL